MSLAVMEDEPALRLRSRARRAAVACNRSCGRRAGDSRQHCPGPMGISGLVLLGAIGAALAVYAHFWTHSRDLWWWMGHDRHTHYMFGLNLALDMRTRQFRRGSSTTSIACVSGGRCIRFWSR